MFCIFKNYLTKKLIYTLILRKYEISLVFYFKFSQSDRYISSTKFFVTPKTTQTFILSVQLNKNKKYVCLETT